MAPPPVTEDYYLILEVEQTATSELIARSYKRLALKLHPDRNARHNATAAFQLLAKAYETLKDESKRRTYDLIYPSIRQGASSTTRGTTTGSASSASTPQAGPASETAQIVALQKARQDREARWQTQKNTFDSSIFEMQRKIRRIEQEIKTLNSIAEAEAAEEAQKNSWTTWFLSPITKKVKESEEDTARKSVERQERGLEKDMKERRLEAERASLKTQETLLRDARKLVDDADLCDSRKIQTLQERRAARERLEREMREREERERQEQIRRREQEVREQRAREAAAAWETQQAEQRAARQKQQEEERRRYQRMFDETRETQQRRRPAPAPTPAAAPASRVSCDHDGWWPKVEGRAACSQCADIWTYLLRCPGCSMMACPACQSELRPRRRRRNARRTQTRPRSPSPEFYGFSNSYYD